MTASALAQLLPDAGLVLWWTPPMLIYGGLAALLAGYLRQVRRVRTPYTRKIFHFLIFSGATVVQVLAGLPGVVLYGSLISGLVVLAVWKGDGNALYEAMARPNDSPHRGRFIVIPMITTAVGGLVANLVFGSFAAVGYLACGWGDAIGEPVGVRWGRHRYAVPSLFGVRAERSLEGSLAVLMVAWLASAVALLALGVDGRSAALVGGAAGLTSAAVEAVSNHGLDNLTIQVAASAVAWALLS